MTDQYREMLDARAADTDAQQSGPLDIVLYPEVVLRTVAEPIVEFSSDLRNLYDEMMETMYNAQGVGLAAPQIGKSIRLLVMDPMQDGAEPTVMINPEILASDGYSKAEEGCLSIPDFRADVERASQITVAFQDLDGHKQKLDLYDFPAIVVQHELDHLNGVLFVDRISRLKRADFLRRFGIEKRKFTKPKSLARLPGKQ